MAGLAGLTGPAAAQEAAEPVAFEADYSAYYLGLKLMETGVEAEFGPKTYGVRSMYKTGGLLAWAKKDQIRSMVRGRTDGEALKPDYFEHRDILEHGRTVQMAFTPEDIEVTATPPYSSFGDPPATQADRQGSLDLVSGIMQTAMNVGDDPDWPCGPDVPIFNGKERYNLRMAHAGAEEADLDAYEGPVIACHVYYMPLAGFDADDVPKEKYLNTPITVWFTDRPGDDFHVPIRFSYPVGIATLVIEAKSLTLGPVPSEHAER